MLSSGRPELLQQCRGEIDNSHRRSVRNPPCCLSYSYTQLFRPHSRQPILQTNPSPPTTTHFNQFSNAALSRYPTQINPKQQAPALLPPTWPQWPNTTPPPPNPTIRSPKTSTSTNPPTPPPSPATAPPRKLNTLTATRIATGSSRTAMPTVPQILMGNQGASADLGEPARRA